jgi:Xaa-Pro aminopeptidase
MSSERLAALRALLVEHSLDALIVPTEDAHQSEYVAPRDKRRQFISNFSGSAGTVVVTSTEAMLWTDGRYWLQAQQQLEPTWTLMRTGDASVPTVGEWLAQHLPDARVGFDPSVTSVGTHRRLALEAGARCHLTPTPANLIDLLWTDRPARSESPIAIHAPEYAGRSVADKLTSVRSSFAAVGAGKGALQQCGAHVITSLDCVAWLFNLRGDDIPFNPVCAWQILIRRMWHCFPLTFISLPLCFRFHRCRFFIRLHSSPRRRLFCLLMKIRSAMLCVRTSLPPVSSCGRMRRSSLR